MYKICLLLILFVLLVIVVKKENKELFQNYKNKELNDEKIIHICFCSDINLINFIPTVINGILLKNKNKIQIHYIHDITDRRIIENLRSYVNKFKNLLFKDYYKVWNYSYNGLKHVTNATMLSLFIPELISVKKIIYLDIDIVVNLNLNKLYNLDCGETGICLKDSVKQDWEIIFKDRKKKSGNCGIIVLDLDKLRKNNFTNKCLEICKKFPDRHDQYIINIYCNGKHKNLFPNYNIYVNQDEYLIKKHKNYILHYAGSKKPYFINTGKYQYLWDRLEYLKIMDLGKKIVPTNNNYKFFSGFINLLKIKNIIYIGHYDDSENLTKLSKICNHILTCNIKKKNNNKFNKKILRFFGNPSSNNIFEKIKKMYDEINDNFLLIIDVNDTSFTEIITKKYLFDKIKYVFFTNITRNPNTNIWWNKFKKNKNNLVNLNDYFEKTTFNNGLGYWIIE